MATMAMRVQPIRPEDVEAQKHANVPNEVIEAWNETIAKHYNNGRSSFPQIELINCIARKTSITDHFMIRNSGWLDLEEVYRKQGWSVDYDRPAYNESYEPRFTFEKRK